MIEISFKGAMVCVLVAAGAGAALWAGLSRDADEERKQIVPTTPPPVSERWGSIATDHSWDAYASTVALLSEDFDEALIASLPPELISLARETTWDSHACSILALYLESTFDYDDDGTLDDAERIIAVRALRDAVWPDAFADAGEAPHDDVEEAPIGGVAAAELSPRDRRLYHDVDEARRRDHEEAGGADELDPAQREEIHRRFSIEPDGHLSVAELSRFMSRFHAASAVADLDGDGVVADRDLRLFLNVASPIDDAGPAK